MRRFLSVCLAGITIAACGGGSAKVSNHSGAARDAVSQYLKALESRDWSTACGDIASATKRKLQTDAGGVSCAAAFAAVAARDAQAVAIFKELGNATVGTVSTHGDAGTASISFRGRTLKIPLVKEGGAWKVESSG